MLYAVLCEGTAEQEIVTVLLKNKLLKFTESELLFGKILRYRSGKSFFRECLSYDFDSDEEIIIYRVHDSTTENFIIPKEYKNKIYKVIDIMTKPEIEMLMIYNEGLYDEYEKKGLKPSSFIKSKKQFKKDNVKSRDFQRKYWGSDKGKSLSQVIKIYHNKHSKKNMKNKKDLYFLMKN